MPLSFDTYCLTPIPSPEDEMVRMSLRISNIKVIKTLKMGILETVTDSFSNQRIDSFYINYPA